MHHNPLMSSAAFAQVMASIPEAPAIIEARATHDSNGLAELFAAERTLKNAGYLDRDPVARARTRIGRYDIAERRAADKRRKLAKKEARRLKRARS